MTRLDGLQHGQQYQDNVINNFFSTTYLLFAVPPVWHIGSSSFGLFHTSSYRFYLLLLSWFINGAPASGSKKKKLLSALGLSSDTIF